MEMVIEASTCVTQCQFRHHYVSESDCEEIQALRVPVVSTGPPTQRFPIEETPHDRSAAIFTVLAHLNKEVRVYDVVISVC